MKVENFAISQERWQNKPQFLAGDKIFHGECVGRKKKKKVLITTAPFTFEKRKVIGINGKKEF